jgi:DNA modification methylase
LIAAEQTGRVCYGVELDPKYVDVIVRRWQQYTGKKALLDGDSGTFDEIAEERRKSAT